MKPHFYYAYRLCKLSTKNLSEFWNWENYIKTTANLFQARLKTLGKFPNFSIA